MVICPWNCSALEPCTKSTLYKNVFEKLLICIHAQLSLCKLFFFFFFFTTSGVGLSNSSSSDPKLPWQYFMHNFSTLLFWKTAILPFKLQSSMAAVVSGEKTSGTSKQDSWSQLKCNLSNPVIWRSKGFPLSISSLLSLLRPSVGVCLCVCMCVYMFVCLHAWVWK